MGTVALLLLLRCLEWEDSSSRGTMQECSSKGAMMLLLALVLVVVRLPGVAVTLSSSRVGRHPGRGSMQQL
jgi:hypothetical protein